MCLKYPTLGAFSAAGYITAVVMVVRQDCSSNVWFIVCLQLKSRQVSHVYHGILEQSSVVFVE